MFDLSIFSDIELAKLAIMLREYPEDREYLNAVLIELGRRQKDTSSV